MSCNGNRVAVSSADARPAVLAALLDHVYGVAPVQTVGASDPATPSRALTHPAPQTWQAANRASGTDFLWATLTSPASPLSLYAKYPAAAGRGSPPFALPPSMLPWPTVDVAHRHLVQRELQDVLDTAETAMRHAKVRRRALPTRARARRSRRASSQAYGFPLAALLPPVHHARLLQRWNLLLRHLDRSAASMSVLDPVMVRRRPPPSPGSPGAVLTPPASRRPFAT